MALLALGDPITATVGAKASAPTTITADELPATGGAGHHRKDGDSLGNDIQQGVDVVLKK